MKIIPQLIYQGMVFKHSEQLMTHMIFIKQLTQFYQIKTTLIVYSFQMSINCIFQFKIQQGMTTQ